MTYKVFVDANIFFAAAKSSTGGSFFVIELAKQKRIEVITVAHALAEAERNIQKKIGSTALLVHYENLLKINPTVQSLVRVPKILEARIQSCLPEKDLPIVIGAFLSGAEFLVTLDQKHFLRNQKLRLIKLPFSILTPGDLLQQYIV